MLDLTADIQLGGNGFAHLSRGQLCAAEGYIAIFIRFGQCVSGLHQLLAHVEFHFLEAFFDGSPICNKADGNIVLQIQIVAGKFRLCDLTGRSRHGHDAQQHGHAMGMIGVGIPPPVFSLSSSSPLTVKMFSAWNFRISSLGSRNSFILFPPF